MMNAEIKSIVSQFDSVASHLLLRSPRHFVAFGKSDFDDVVIRGSVRKEFNDSVILEHGTKSDHLPADCEYLFQQIIALSDQGVIADFILSLGDLKLIQFVLKKINATHIRFYSESASDQIQVSIFDIRKLSPTHQLLRRSTTRLYKHSIIGTARDRFSTTIMANSFLLLKASQTVTVSPNGITKFDNSDENAQYLMRDQEIVEPITFFTSERLKTNISFSFHPKLTLQDPNTSQFEDQQLKFDES
jgi:hypothetical protein